MAFPVTIFVEDELPNRNHPQILYWYWTPETVKDGRYLADLDEIAAKSPFDLVFITARNDLSFYNFTRMHPVFSEAVKKAHKLGIKIGLQLWPDCIEHCLQSYDPADVPSWVRNLRPDQWQGVVVEGLCTLDGAGRGQYSAETKHVRFARPLQSDLLKAYAFQPGGEGFYVASSLVDITARCVAISQNVKGVKISIDAGAELAGCSVYVMTVHYHEYADLFSDHLIRSFENALMRYGDIPFDGTALDEFGYIMVTPPWKMGESGAPFRERLYSAGMAESYRRQTGEELARGLFDMRYAPAGEPRVRMRAINRYFDVLRQGPLPTERAFYEISRRVFGPDVFVGVHNTFHNSLHCDEIWRTAINWWDLPREYGQTDEDIGFPFRMGVACSCPRNITYDMFYAHDMERYFRKAVEDARFNGRIHYHAFNDVLACGKNLQDDVFMAKITPIERKIRLLNWFDGPLPGMDILIVFGFPAVCNWYPDEARRNNYDISDTLMIGEKAGEIWNAGYLCAIVPSTAIETGKLAVDGAACVYNGRRFPAMAFLCPQYSKVCAIEFLEKYVAGGGRLILDGEATHDFDGSEIGRRVAEIRSRSAATDLSVPILERLGFRRNMLTDGCYLQDGSVILTDYVSLVENRAEPFALDIRGRQFRGEYRGVMGLKVDDAGQIEKFVCGGFSRLARDGREICALQSPADLVLLRDDGGQYRAWIEKTQASNMLTCFQGDGPISAPVR